MALPEFQGFNPDLYIHPFIQYGKYWLESNPNFIQADKLESYSPNERHLLLANLLYHSPIIKFQHPKAEGHSPITISPSLLLANFAPTYSIIQWTANISENNLALLPQFSITKDSADLMSFVEGYVPTLLELRNKIRNHDRDQALDRALERLDKMAKRRIAFGRQPLNRESLLFIFSCSKIPESLREFYIELFHLEPIRIATSVDNPIVNMLDLEEYLEDWYSSSLIKLFALKIIRQRIQILKELGCTLPSEYFVFDEATGEYKPTFKTRSGPTFSFSGFKPSEAPVEVAPKLQIPKPMKAQFEGIAPYARALAAWHRGVDWRIPK